MRRHPRHRVAQLDVVTSQANVADWIEGARLRTLPAAISPVVAGTGAAAAIEAVVWWKAAMALVLALAMQIGVNFANDYSDGIRGTDADRVGPARLVGSGLASPRTVKGAAFACFALGAVCGFVLAATTSWWLLAIGVAAIAAAWTYTGGPRPYGYHALGEVSVFVFFGLVAVLGTTFVQAQRLTTTAWLAAVAVGCLACAILVANNLRDIPTDRDTGKHTLAVVLGDTGSRVLYVTLMVVPMLAMATIAAIETVWALLALLCVPFAARAVAHAVGRATGARLVPVLRDTGLTELVWACGLAIGLAL